ncbi:substrate-binding domain-containing protein [Tautonia rosea]|uniref:substrate-binding domain-containing protein n=1 Tax=Tautonia rosea TaxID=2728037 RepID=UPI001475B125|nr:substrate-binding domain-containing protein [Tautonia rosea]
MTKRHEPGGRVKSLRLLRSWSQAELADRAGISRTAVSAVEMGRLVPSVAAALSLAYALGCTVEELFGVAEPPGGPEWAWPPGRDPCRFWRAEVGGRTLLYPVEASPMGFVAHDGISRGGHLTEDDEDPRRTLVLACCDPAVGLLADIYARTTGDRLLVLPRSSGKALALLQAGLVHVAGVHLAAAEEDGGNAEAVRQLVSDDVTLLRVARWEEGVALAPGVAARSVRSTLGSKLTWVGRETGSGARRCLDEVLAGRPAPRRLAYDHRGVAEAIRCGWAEAGVCLRLTGEEAGLQFLGVRVEGYDLCFPRRWEDDPRIQALIRVVRSAPYRRLLAELPGYDPTEAGQVERLAIGPRDTP